MELRREDSPVIVPAFEYIQCRHLTDTGEISHPFMCEHVVSDSNCCSRMTNLHRLSFFSEFPLRTIYFPRILYPYIWNRVFTCLSNNITKSQTIVKTQYSLGYPDSVRWQHLSVPDVTIEIGIIVNTGIERPS